MPRDTPEVVRENLEEKYGLDKPLFEQYTIYMKNLLHGDFGSSMKYKGQTVVGKLASGMPPSALVGFGGVIIGSIIGLVLGCVAALNNKGKVDYLVIILAILGVSIPSFVFGSLIQKIFGVDLKLFPIQGWKGLSYIILPMFTAAFTNIAFYARMLRTSMLDVMKQATIYTAKSKGLNKTEIVKKTYDTEFSSSFGYFFRTNVCRCSYRKFCGRENFQYSWNRAGDDYCDSG